MMCSSDGAKWEQAQHFFRTVFDSNPLPMFIVDRDVRILERNAAADQLLGPKGEAVLYRRGGEALDCLHAKARGCGQSDRCRYCVIRQGVRLALEGHKTHRQMHAAEVCRQDKSVTVDLLVSATPLTGGESEQVLLILEDISELVTLRGLIPICTRCKKVRADQQYWQSIEGYLEAHTNLEFTHGYCPTCFSEQMKSIEAFRHRDEAAQEKAAA